MEHSNKPLTFEKLKKMDGHPVWYKQVKRWFIVSLNNKKFGDCIIGSDFYTALENAVKNGVYGYPPAHIDREAWKPCEECESLQYIMGANYCEKCGRPLTDEAWDDLEKRIGG